MIIRLYNIAFQRGAPGHGAFGYGMKDLLDEATGLSAGVQPYRKLHLELSISCHKESDGSKLHVNLYPSESACCVRAPDTLLLSSLRLVAISIAST